MMFKKVVGAFLLGIVSVCSLSAELNWWRPKEVTGLNGYTDSYVVAMNQNGTAIAMFDDKVFGVYNVVNNRWNFTYLNWISHELPYMQKYLEGNHNQISIGKPSKGNTILLNASNEGWAIVSIPQGPRKGQIAVVHYSAAGWGNPILLSEKVGKEPTLAQGADGRVLAVWINEAPLTEDDGKLMAAYYNGMGWVKQGIISTYKSVEMEYNQVGPQLVMSDLGDGIVIWKALDKQGANQDALLIAQYFDGVEDRWIHEEVIGVQPLDKKGRDLAINFQGDTLLVWENAEGIEAATMNLMKYMIDQSGGEESTSLVNHKGTETVGSPWVNTTLVQGEELNMPKACLDRKGHGLVVWLEGYDGIRSAYYNGQLKSWKLMYESVSSQAAYATAVKLDAAGRGQVLWIGEGPSLSEFIYSRVFDFNTSTWGTTYVINCHQDSSLIDAIDAFSVAKSNYGIVMWYDFFKEQLFCSVLRGDIESPYNPRKEGRLYKKKIELAKRRAERKQQMSGM